MCKVIKICMFLAVLIGCLVGEVAAEDTAAANGMLNRAPTVPMLGVTRIIPNTFLPDPFVSTKMQLSLGYGRSSRIAVPLIEIDGDPVLGLEGDIMFALLGVEYRHEVRDWMAVLVHVRIAARLGTEIQALLAQGVSAFQGFYLGWIFRLHQTDRHLLSTTFRVSNGRTILVDILGFVDRAIEDGEITEHNRITYNTPTLGTNLELQYVYAANDYIALQALGGLSYAESIDRRVGAEWYYKLGGTVGFDFNQRYSVPIGLVLGYKYNTVPEGGDDIVDAVQSALVNISYTGRPDFGLGFDMEFQRIPLKNFDEEPTFFSVVVSMQYFF